MKHDKTNQPSKQNQQKAHNQPTLTTPQKNPKSKQHTPTKKKNPKQTNQPNKWKAKRSKQNKNPTTPKYF